MDVFAEFERNIGGFKELVRSAVTATESVDTCGHCRAHDGVTLPIELLLADVARLERAGAW